MAYALTLGNGVQLPFLPLWLHAQGLSTSAIATVIAAMTVVRVGGAPFFAAIADATGRRFLVIRGCAIATFFAYFLLGQTDTFQTILAAGALAAFVFAPVMPLIEGYSVESAARIGLDYGRIRLWASLSFLTGSLGAGALLTVLPPEAIMPLLVGAQFLTAVATFILPPEPPHPAHLPQVSAVELGPALRFLFASRFTVFLFAASLANCSHGALYAIGSVYWQQLGYDSFHIGVFWAAAVLAEVVLFFFSGRLVSRVPLPNLLCIGLAGATLRWTGMGFATQFWQIFLLQTLHSLSFASAHLSLMNFIRLHAPANLRNSAQGVYTAFASGLLLSSAQWAAGPLFEAYGAGVFWLMAAIAGAGLGVALFNMLRLSPRAPAAAAALRP